VLNEEKKFMSSASLSATLIGFIRNRLLNKSSFFSYFLKVISNQSVFISDQLSN
jgi:hypothetical protein